MKGLWIAFIFYGLWLLASSEYHIYQNRFLDRWLKLDLLYAL
jgi:hypothetical protein